MVSGRNITKWRKRMGKKVRSILRRLDRLERAIRNQRKALREFQGVKASTDASISTNIGDNPQNVRWGAGKKDGELVIKKFTEKPPLEKEKKRRKALGSRNSVKSNVTTISPRLRTEKPSAADPNQPQCRSHTGCRPGFCCQRERAAGRGTSLATCVHYNLSEGASCEHSCACSAQLQCFKGASGKTAAVCKTASARDILEGAYLNARDTSF